jgi:hypothetical protein
MVLAEKGLSDSWSECSIKIRALALIITEIKCLCVVCTEDNVDVWENLLHALEKYSVDKKCIELTMKKLKTKYGEKPTEAEIRVMLT